MRILPEFEQHAPEVDESALPGENAPALALRLAIAKAQGVAALRGDCIVIGSDQAVECDGRILGKPGDAAAARAQLASFSGRSVRFHTAACVLDPCHPRTPASVTDVTTVVFRILHPDEIARYVQREQAFDCAGSFKMEGLGIVLFERVTSEDPTALVGLPLIALGALLRRAGLMVP